jgi:hypothetical protein
MKAFRIDSRETGKLDVTQLKALKEFLPTEEERRGLEAYQKQHEEPESKQRDSYQALSECEKYMTQMMLVNDAAAKFDCMIYRVQFKSRFGEIVESIKIVDKACDEVRSSEKLREIMVGSRSVCASCLQQLR